MTIQQYPAGLPLMTQASKVRTQPASFRATNPRQAFSYVHQTGTDNPVTWDCTFVFKQADAIRFKLWRKFDLDNDIREFVMPIRTEFGLVEHVCRFLPNEESTEIADVWRYSMQIQSRALVMPAYAPAVAGFVVAAEDPAAAASALDIAVAGAPDGVL